MTLRANRTGTVPRFGQSLALLAVCIATSTVHDTPKVIDGPSTSAASPPAPRLFHGFVENQGQWPTEARFVADFGDLLVRAEPGAIALQKEALLDGQPRVGVVRLTFEGAGSVEPFGGELALGEFNFLLGDDPSLWRRHVPPYLDVVYPDVLPGADVRLYRKAGRVEYDVLVSPSSDIDDLAVRCEGIEGLIIADNGDLRMETPLGPVVQHAPLAWQVTANGESIPAKCSFRVLDERHFGLAVPDRIAGSSLVIDPGLTWASFLGGSGADYALKVQVLANGDVAVLGRGNSPDFPTTAGVFDAVSAGFDATVTCMEPTGSSLVFSTYIGGSGTEVPRCMTLSSEGAVAVAGYTNSVDFPTLSNAYDGTFNGGTTDGFACVLSPDGSDLVFSTLVGGTCNEYLTGIDFAADGLIVVGGYTCSPDFPVTPGAFDASLSGQADGVVAWFDPALSGSVQLVSSSLLGGTGIDEIFDLVMGSDDQPIVVGTTQMPIGQLSDFPTTSGAYDESPGGQFVTRVAADGSDLVASTHFKGGQPVTVAVDGATILIAGYSWVSETLPVSPTAFDSTKNGGTDGFVARLDDQLADVLAATYFGGSGDESPSGMAIDVAGRIAIAGLTDSANYPTTPGAFDTVYEGPLATSMVSYFTADLSTLLYSSYLGPASQSSSQANDVAAMGEADVVLVGQGAKTGFPVTPGAFDETFNGGTLGGADGYVARMLLGPLPWGYLGGAIAGTAGTPLLAGSGDLIGGQPVTLTLSAAKALTPVTLIIGLSILDAPFKSGVLVPNPTFLIFGLPTNAHGTLALSTTWPSGLPSGFTFYTQYWIPDAAGPAGFAASNGLSGTTP
jgi:hypothetical protein